MLVCQLWARACGCGTGVDLTDGGVTDGGHVSETVDYYSGINNSNTILGGALYFHDSIMGPKNLV